MGVSVVEGTSSTNSSSNSSAADQKRSLRAYFLAAVMGPEDAIRDY